MDINSNHHRTNSIFLIYYVFPMFNTSSDDQQESENVNIELDVEGDSSSGSGDSGGHDSSGE